MIPAEDPSVVNLFKKRLTGDPALDTAAKLMTRKLEILKATPLPSPIGSSVDVLVETERFFFDLPNSGTLSFGEYVNTSLTGKNRTRFDIVTTNENETLKTSFIQFLPVNSQSPLLFSHFVQKWNMKNSSSSSKK